MFKYILNAFGLPPENYQVDPFGSGLINHTWKVSGGGSQYILQRINKTVFQQPLDIASNLLSIGRYLKETAPGYLFAAPITAPGNQSLITSADDNYYRLSPFINNSHTIDFITNSDQAYQAAKQFGKFSRLLNNFDVEKLAYTLPDFHNLSLRYEQYKEALLNANNTGRLQQAQEANDQIVKNNGIVETYEQLVAQKSIPLRVIHHDTKINNVLFDDNDKGICVIDLDTVMPGYYISDLGDMMRTYLSEANEEEQDLDKIRIREDVFYEIYRGYMEEMGNLLNAKEKSLFLYSGSFMIYMQAIRFLTDFLNGDVYYQTSYPLHNLVRAQNQLTLLNLYNQSREKFKKLIQA